MNDCYALHCPDNALPGLNFHLMVVAVVSQRYAHAHSRTTEGQDQVPQMETHAHKRDAWFILLPRGSFLSGSHAGESLLSGATVE